MNIAPIRTRSHISHSQEDSGDDSAGSLKDFVVSDGDVSYEDSDSAVSDKDDEKPVRRKNKRKRDSTQKSSHTFKRLRKGTEFHELINDSKPHSRSDKKSVSGAIEPHLFYHLCPDPELSIGKEVVGREKEALQIVSMVEGPKGGLRPLLIGPEGIGKRSILEKVAYLLKTRLKHPLWKYLTIYRLNAEQLQKTSDYRGNEISIAEQFEQFVNDTFQRKSPGILYVHDIDKLVSQDEGAQAVQSALEKPFPFIASISGDPKDVDVIKTITKLQKYNFEPIVVQESSVEDVENIVKAYLTKNPTFPNLKISKGTIPVGVRLADKYIRSRPFPIKAINLIHECANAVLIDHITKQMVPDEIRVTPEEIAKLMEVKTKVSAEDLLNASVFSETRFVAKLKDHLIGQDYAIERVSEAVASFKMCLADPSKPWGVFLFVGPTGVGKTELAKLLVRHLYQDEEAFVRIDGTEFQESHTISRLIGAPPGYEGHETGGQLTEALRRNRHLVVLFDEFEKAHNDVRRLFLQVFDNGRLTDGRGKTVDCTQALFIMTSNLGSKELFEQTAKEDMDPKAVLKTIDSILIENLSPELCNRFTAIVPFQSLKEIHVPGVIGVQLKRMAERLRTQRNIELTWTEELIKHFAACNFDPRLGMRNLCRFIDKSIVGALKDAFSEQQQAFKGKIRISVRDDELIVQMKKG